MTTYQEISAQFYSNRLLFGDPADAGVVAVEVASKTEIDVYKRVAGKLTRERRPIRLFALVENVSLLEGFKAPHETRVLDGDFRYRILVTLQLDGRSGSHQAPSKERDRPTAQRARRAVPGAGRSGRAAPDADRHDVFHRDGFRRAAPPATRHRDFYFAGV